MEEFEFETTDNDCDCWNEPKLGPSNDWVEPNYLD